jgi:hypothetical protein
MTESQNSAMAPPSFTNGHAVVKKSGMADMAIFDNTKIYVVLTLYIEGIFVLRQT